MGLEKASRNIKLVEENCKSEAELCAYVDKVLPRRIPWTGPSWEIHYVEKFNENESAMVLVAQHSLGDGLSA